MKKIRVLSFMFLTLLLVGATFTSCGDSDDDIILEVQDTLTNDEVANLLFMREEEKLARDVYLSFHEMYGLNMFSNIASSEQYHMDAILVLINKYNLEDPASNDRGVFTNTDLQDLHDALIQQGEVSLIEALMVGATIEDVDIRDLDNAISLTSKDDIIGMYDMLNCGSRNHMRAFTSQINAQNESYIPQFISLEQYNEVINSSHEQCGR